MLIVEVAEFRISEEAINTCMEMSTNLHTRIIIHMVMAWRVPVVQPCLAVHGLSEVGLRHTDQGL